MKIKIGLLGLGRSGKVVAQSLQKDKRFDLLFTVKNKVAKTEDFDFLVEPKERIDGLFSELKPDMVIDFTTPDAVMRNIKKLSDETGYIIATTGFSDEQLQQLKDYNNLKILYAPNISDGINIVMKLCELLNQLWRDADVEIIEQHFRAKKDSPSGTAQELSKLFDQETPIHSVRAGNITGIHEVILATDNQKITIRHESYSREVFADGAKRAALWLMDKPCGFYEIHEAYR